MEIPLPPASNAVEDDRLLSDVVDLPKKSYSLEEEKNLKDQDEKQAAAERNKEQIRAEILYAQRYGLQSALASHPLWCASFSLHLPPSFFSQLRRMFEALLKLNQSLDPDQRLPRSAFELDSRVRAQLENEVRRHRAEEKTGRTSLATSARCLSLTSLPHPLPASPSLSQAKARVQEVQQEMAWETERHEILLRKLRSHFLAPLEVELIELKAFRTGLTVHSFRAPALPPFVVEALRKVRHSASFARCHSCPCP